MIRRCHVKLLLTSRQDVRGKAQNGLALVRLQVGLLFFGKTGKKGGQQLQICTTVSTLFFKIPTSNEL